MPEARVTCHLADSVSKWHLPSKNKLCIVPLDRVYSLYAVRYEFTSSGDSMLVFVVAEE